MVCRCVCVRIGGCVCGCECACVWVCVWVCGMCVRVRAKYINCLAENNQNAMEV